MWSVWSHSWCRSSCCSTGTSLSLDVVTIIIISCKQIYQRQLVHARLKHQPTVVVVIAHQILFSHNSSSTLRKWCLTMLKTTHKEWVIQSSLQPLCWIDCHRVQTSTRHAKACCWCSLKLGRWKTISLVLIKLSIILLTRAQSLTSWNSWSRPTSESAETTRVVSSANLNNKFNLDKGCKPLSMMAYNIGPAHLDIKAHTQKLQSVLFR